MKKKYFIYLKLTLSLVIFFINGKVNAQTSVTFSTTSPWQCPAGVTQISIEAWGGGGAGGGTTVNLSAGGGGAGGAYVKNATLTVTPGAFYTITVGGTKAGTTGGSQNGNPSSFALTATPAVLLINAVGGNGGFASTIANNSAAGGAAVSTGNIGGITANIYGLAGLQGTGIGGSRGGDGGASGGGAPGGIGSTNNSSGAAGSTYGGGGAGARRASGTRIGGVGAAGQIIITYDSPEIDLLGNSISIPNNDTTPLFTDGTDFGENYTGTSLSHTFTIQNLGNLPLTIGTISFSGTNASEFTVTTAPSSSVAAGASTTFVVQFLPTAAGARSATISIVNNDTDENPYKFKLQGTGVVAGYAPKIQVTGNSVVIPTNNYTSTTTDYTNLGDTFTTAITRTYYIKNLGTSNLTIGAISFSGTDATQFTIQTSPSTSLASGATTSFIIKFTPTSTGVKNARIAIINNDTNPFNFSISATSFTASTNPEIDIKGNSISIASGDITPSLTDNTDFGSTQIITSVIKTFTIQNQGTNGLILGTSPYVTITPSTDFTLVSPPTSPITSLNTSAFSIQFNPNTIGTKTATVSIASNDSNENPYAFRIQGTGDQKFYDSDGDGIFDNVDIDDDNDGIRDGTEELNCSNSLGHKVDYKFLNETFGSGPRVRINTTYDATTTYGFQDATTPTDVEGSGASIDLNDGKYTVGSSAQISSWASDYWYKGTDHTGDTNGRMAIFNASNTPGIFYTALITGALPNIPISYNFYVLNLDRTDAQNIGTRIRPNIRVEFRDLNNNLINFINTGPIQPTTAGNLTGDWNLFSATIPALNVTAFKVVFVNNETGGLGNDLALDDILITQTLCDYDGDGIPDLFDLDSDNDGIPDVVEAGTGNLSNGKGKIDVAWVDTNTNGMYDAVESNTPLNSDGDSQPNYIDLDSDNDSIFDIDESGAGNSNAVAGFQNGDGDINGNGTGDGLETELFRFKDSNGDGTVEYFGDGILDIFDKGNGATFIAKFGNAGQGIANVTNPTATYLLDSDNDGIPDYIDITSQGTGKYDIDITKILYQLPILDSNIRGVINTTTDVDYDGIPDLYDTNSAVFGSPRNINTKLYLDFDGRNDYAESTTVIGGLAKASLMAWIDLNSGFTTDGVVIGEKNFQIKITSTRQLQVILNGTTLDFTTIPTLVPPFPFTSTSLNTKQWYHVGTTYDGATLKLFLNGTLVARTAETGAITNDSSKLTIGKNPSTATTYFKGKIDEVRVFNIGLTDSQLQRMVYQEIDETKAQLTGKIIPKTIAEITEVAVPLNNMIRYYRMDTYKDDIIDDLTTPAIDLTGTKIFNHKVINVQQAPMPFETIKTGNFAVAVDNPLQDVRGLDVTDNDYSIIKVHHDITETTNSIDLGMFVDSGKTITMNNDTKLQNDWYLKLDGKIDLQGRSQLVQTTNSDLDKFSAGSIERDQQGQGNKFNYNYWSSPVSPINNTANNTNYTVAGVMKDGINSVPRDIKWISGYDGIPGTTTTPVSLARYWLNKFESDTDEYANWIQFLEDDELRVGQGYTLKASGAVTNFTFVGKPNNGQIQNYVGENQLLLIGNPYPSALDAYKFLDDNLAVNQSTIDGTIYFWQHAPENNTHIFANYLGSYGVLNRTGGVPAMTPALISGPGTANKIPNQFIPVGQGFFVYGTPSGGNVEFNNSQRAFYIESSLLSNPLFRKKEVTNVAQTQATLSENNKKIRLGHNTINGYHRQVLLAFMDEKATSGMDYGYDSEIMDNFPNDMYLYNNETELVIQGEGYFEENTSYPIGVRIETAGKVSFGIDALENFDTNQTVYIYDAQTNIYHSITDKTFEIDLPVGIVNNRFSLRFTDRTLGVQDNAIENSIAVHYTQATKILTISNSMKDNTVETVSLYDLQGKLLSNWEVKEKEQTDIKIQVQPMATGVYIVKLKTMKGNISKKIIVR